MSLLEVRRVTKAFGGLRAIDDVSLSVEEGSITGIIGPNGAGKTTLFNLISGFQLPDSGTIEFSGQLINGMPPWKVAQLGLGRTFQTPRGFPTLSIWENFMVGGSTVPAESLLGSLAGNFLDAERRTSRLARHLLEALDLAPLTRVALEDISAAETKQAEFGRHLLGGPKLLLLDEPAASVDSLHINHIVKQIQQWNDRGITMLVVEHNLSFLFEIADFVYVFADGRGVAAGPPESVSQDPKVHSTYFGESHGTP